MLTRTGRDILGRATYDRLNDGAAGSTATAAEISELRDVTDKTSRAPVVAHTQEREARHVAGVRGRTSNEWHTETSSKVPLVTALISEGWLILSVTDTAAKVGAGGGLTVGVEGKGFPSRVYADPARAGGTKTASRSTQTAHWYSQAVLSAMCSRGEVPTWSRIIAVPDFPRHRDSYSETRGSLAAACALCHVCWLADDVAGPLMILS